MDHPLQSGLDRRGLWFDAAVLVGNIFLLGPLTELAGSEGESNPRFGVLLLVAALVYAFGAGFKRRPLQARLASAARPAMGIGMMLFFFILMVMHLALFLLCAMAGAEMIHGTPLGNTPAGAPQVVETIGLVTLGLAPTVMALRAMVKPRAADRLEPPAGGREAAADLLLYASCMIILALWNSSLAELFAGVQASLPMRLLLIVLITVPFAIFYLAPRVLFLLEDYRRPQTWGTIVLAMLPLAVRIVMHGGALP